MWLIECIKTKKLQRLSDCVTCNSLKRMSSGAKKKDSYVECKIKGDLIRRYGKQPEEI